MAHKVFICHSSKDKAIADAACAALEAHRIPCWIAPRDILAGVEYGEAIIDALKEAEIVLIIFSSHANESQQIRREIERAVSKGKIILPYRIEDILPSGALEYALSNTHWLDAIPPPIERRLAELSETVERLLRMHPHPSPTASTRQVHADPPQQQVNSPRPPMWSTDTAPPAAAREAPASKGPSSSKLPVILGALAILVVALVALHPWASQPSAGGQNIAAPAGTIQTAPASPGNTQEESPPVAISSPVSQPPSAPAEADAEPFFMERTVTDADLVGKSSRDIQIMRNEIYARHGRRFETPWIQAYFDAQSWYKPTYSPNEFPTSLLTQVQVQNVAILSKLEAK